MHAISIEFWKVGFATEDKIRLNSNPQKIAHSFMFYQKFTVHTCFYKFVKYAWKTVHLFLSGAAIETQKNTKKKKMR